MNESDTFKVLLFQKENMMLRINELNREIEEHQGKERVFQTTIDELKEQINVIDMKWNYVCCFSSFSSQVTNVLKAL